MGGSGERRAALGRHGHGWYTRAFVLLALVSTSLVVRGIFPQPGLALAPPPAVTEFQVPINGSDPLGVTSGPGNALWVADSNDFNGQKVEKMTTTGAVTGYNVPGGQSPSCPQGCVDPASIVQGPDGNLWFTELTSAANAVARLNPSTGVVTTFDVGITPASEPWGLTIGSDKNLWFTENVPGGRIGRITTAGVVTEFPVSTPANTPFGITSGPDGNLWFTEQSSASTPTKVGVMTVTGAMVTEITIDPTGQGLSGITTANDGNLWVTEQSGHQIVGINWMTKAVIKRVGDGTLGPGSLVNNPADGLLYFIETTGNSIGRFNPNDPAPTISHFGVPTAGAFSGGAPPQGITVGPDGNIWFAEGSPKADAGPSPIHALGRLTLGPAVAFSATSEDFGAKAIGASGSQTLTITSAGVANLTFGGNGGGFTIAGSSDFHIANNTCASTLTPSSPTCSVGLTFTPSGYGPRSATLQVSDNATNVPSPQSITLTGSGFVATGVASPSPTSLDFGSQTVNTTGAGQPVTVTNPGNAALAVSDVTIGGDSPGDFSKTADTCTGRSVAAQGGTCSVSVTFAPTAAGSRAAILTFSDSAQDSPQRVPLSGQGLAVAASPPPGPTPSPGPPAPAPSAGYWLAGSDGGIFNFGSAGLFGSTGSIHLNKPIVGMARTPTGRGYWLVATDGGIFNFGDARFFGSTGAIHLNQPIVAMAPTPSGQGYWLVAADGGIFNFGSAGFFGSTGAIHLNQPIVAMAPTPDGAGYWLTATDGGIFNFGSAGFFGSTGAIHLNRPVVAMAATQDGGGYWLTATDGGIFNFGSAGFFGSTGAIHLNQPIVAMAPTPDGAGYWLTATDGGIFNFGSAGFFGSTGAIHLNRPVVAMAPSPSG